MIILSMETSTPLGGVSIFRDDQLLAKEETTRYKSHSDILHVFIENCLKKAGLTLEQIDLFAVGNGPGSFTGVRVAGNAGKTFSYFYKKPLVAVSSLSNLAYQFMISIKSANLKEYTISTMINAYKNMVYFSQFEIKNENLTQTVSPCAIPVKKLVEYINKQTYVVGDGYDTYKEYFSDEVARLMSRPKSCSDFPKAEIVAVIGKKMHEDGQSFEWKFYKPLYIRASEAEENLKGVVLTPLK